jgi:hypothetical protein
VEKNLAFKTMENMDKNSESIILFDSISDLDDLDKISSKHTSKIISFDYDTHKILKDKKINHETSDRHLSKNDLKIIQKTAYSISEWYNSDVISEDIFYKGVNLGSLVKAELINILVNYIKKFFELYKISNQFTNSTFIGSQTCCKIMENFSKKIIKFKNSNTENFQLIPLDSIKIKMKIGTKNHSMEFGISNNLFKKLKNVSEKSSKFLLSKNNSIGEASKNILIIEFDPIKYQSFFEQMSKSDLNFLMYNQRRPAIWNIQSYNLIKKSGCLIQTKNSLSNANLIKTISNEKFQFEAKMTDLFSNESFFKSFFSIEGISFWPTFKEYFQEYFRKRALEFIEEVELTKKLMEKYDFSSILILSEVGPNERIALQLAHQRQIPVCLVQHGINYDTKESYDMNAAKGALPIESDHFLCWGKIGEEFSQNMGINSEKVHSVGSPIFDRLRFDEYGSLKNDCVLLAPAGPTKEHASDLTIEIIEKYMDAIKKICQLVTKYNKKLIIKVHPSPDELDPSFIAKQINSQIKVVKEGNISPLVQSCDLMIVIDFGSPILDAHILKKPVISVSVKDNGWGIPTALKNNSCLTTDLEKFEDDLKDVLNNDNIRNQLIKNGTKSSNEYLSYQNNGSSKLIEFLEELVN